MTKIRADKISPTDLPQIPASPTVRTGSQATALVGIILFAMLFIAGGGWLYAANLAGAVIAQGTVVVEGKPKTVQHLDGGIIEKIHVADGDLVSQGDILVRLDETLLNANRQIYTSRLQEAVARRGRLLAERDELDSIGWDETVLDLLEVQQKETVRVGHEKLFETRKAAKAGQIAQLEEQIAQSKSQIDGVDALKDSKSRQIKMVAEELEGILFLKEQGLTTNIQVMNLEREKESLTGQIGEHQAELARISNTINEAQIQILQIEREFRQSVLSELREVEQEVNEMAQQLHATVEQLKRVDIKAPVSGIVHELSIFTIGGVIGPGDAILQIIPQDQELVIEASVEPQFIDELYPEQDATLRFSAFNQRTTPELNGHVRGVSPNVVLDEQTGVSFYKVKLSVSTEELDRLQNLKLIPGMPVEAFIKTRYRSPLNYLVKPLLDQVNRAFREE